MKTIGSRCATTLLGALALLGRSPVVQAGDSPVDAVTGFLAEAKSAEATATSLARWWDGEAFAHRIFEGEWDALDTEERREIGGVAAEFACRKIRGAVRGLPAATGPAKIPEFGPPTPGPDVESLASVAVPVTGAGGEKHQVEFLATRTSTGVRLVDMGGDGAWFSAGFGGIRRALGTFDSPLVFAWHDMARSGVPGSVVPPPTSALYKTRDPKAPEWRTRDLLNLSPPIIPHGSQDERLPVTDDAKWGPRIVVNVSGGAYLTFRRAGRRSPFDAFRVPSEAMPALRAALEDAVRGTKTPPRLLLRADRAARWEYAHAIAMLATAPGVGVGFDGVDFATEDPAGRPTVVRFVRGAFAAEGTEAEEEDDVGESMGRGSLNAPPFSGSNATTPRKRGGIPAGAIVVTVSIARRDPDDASPWGGCPRG